MSRVGKQPILLPAGVTVEVAGATVAVKGSKGESSYTAPECIAVKVEDNTVVVSRADDSRHSAAMFGTVRSIINNMVCGVNAGYKKTLLIDGVGYKAQLNGMDIVLSLGYSHDITYRIPEGIKIDVQGGTTVAIEGIDKQLVGQVAARIRDYSPVEPYKGKGVRYSDEQVRRKEGKAVA
ncbi:MAG: 50S ribosomal protein L6 [Verrucomicrobiota bacterium]